MEKIYRFEQYANSYKFYGGADNKSSINIDGADYMLKFQNTIVNRNQLNSFYSNNIFSEYISCKIIESMGLDTQEVLLGHYNGKLAVACKDFTNQNQNLIEFSKIENRVIDSAHRGRTPILSNLNTIFKSDIFDDKLKVEAKERYWDIFICDALIGNFDRHSGNWGYLIDILSGEMKNAPIYDCGSSLYPQLSDEGMMKVLCTEAEIRERIDKFPKAALIVNGSKINYKTYIGSLENNDCNQALLRVSPKIDLKKINTIIADTPFISEKRKKFYVTMLERRYNEIILEPYKDYARMNVNDNNQMSMDRWKDAVEKSKTSDRNNSSIKPSRNEKKLHMLNEKDR